MTPHAPRPLRSVVHTALLALAAALPFAACDGDPAETAQDLGGAVDAGDAGEGDSASDPTTAPDAATPADADPSGDTTTEPDADPERDATPDAVDNGDTTPPPWVPFVDDGRVPDPRTERLCDEAADPDAAPDTTFIHCRVEGANFAPEPAELPEQLTVVVWNIERGYRIDAQIALLKANTTIPTPDIILASELDRGCSRTGYRNVARDYAEQLGMNYVFATEFIELPREDGAGGRIGELCEHGNAIFSRFPLGNVDARFHRSNKSWYTPPGQPSPTGEPRLGGRSLVWADTRIGDTRISLYSLHYESDPNVLDIQVDQAVETAELAIERGGFALIGGDTNSPTYFQDIRRGRAAEGRAIDRTIAAFLDRGWLDPHRALPYETRRTRGTLVLDLLFANTDVFDTVGVCPPDICTGELSDHQAVWATFRLPR